MQLNGQLQKTGFRTIVVLELEFMKQKFCEKSFVKSNSIMQFCIVQLHFEYRRI